MKSLDAIADLADLPGPVHLAIGFFDGVHTGHQEVIRRAQAAAEADGGTAVTATFDPHPMKFLRPDSAPRLLTSTVHKSLILAQLGVSHLLVIPFDSALASSRRMPSSARSPPPRAPLAASASATTGPSAKAAAATSKP